MARLLQWPAVMRCQVSFSYAPCLTLLLTACGAATDDDSDQSRRPARAESPQAVDAGGDAASGGGRGSEDARLEAGSGIEEEGTGAALPRPGERPGREGPELHGNGGSGVGPSDEGTASTASQAHDSENGGAGGGGPSDWETTGGIGGGLPSDWATGGIGGGLPNDWATGGIGGARGEPVEEREPLNCNTDDAEPRTQHVPEDHTSIQDAIDASKYGDTVLVAPGVYHEHLEMRSGVRLVGSGAELTVLDAEGRAKPLVDFSAAANVLVEGFTLRGVGQAKGCASPGDPLLCAGDWYAAAVYGDSHGHESTSACRQSIRLQHNIIEDNDLGVMLYFRAEGELLNNVFVSNRVGLAANHHANGNGEVTHNLFLNNTHAIAMEASNINITHNVLVGNGTVLRQDNAQRGMLACNLLYGNDALGDRFTQTPELNVVSTESPFDMEFTDYRLSPAGQAATGCADDMNGMIVPGQFGGSLGTW